MCFFFQIVAAVFAIGLALRYFLAYKDGGIYDQVDKKPKILVSKLVPSASVNSIDQVHASQQASSSQTVDKQSKLNDESEKNSLSRTKTMSKAFWKNSSLNSKVLGRRRTVSEGHCYEESSDDSLPGEILNTVSSSPKVEYKERSLEECKKILKQSVCQTLILLYF